MIRFILIISFIILWLLSTSVLADTVIKTFSGNGSKSTRPFKVADKWEVQWNVTGDAFVLYLHTTDGTVIDVLASQEGPGNGASYHVTGGNYYLRTGAMGSWVIKIVQLGNGSSKKNNYKDVKSYKDWQPYKDYLRLPDGYHSPEMENHIKILTKQKKSLKIYHAQKAEH